MASTPKFLLVLECHCLGLGHYLGTGHWALGTGYWVLGTGYYWGRRVSLRLRESLAVGRVRFTLLFNLPGVIQWLNLPMASGV